MTIDEAITRTEALRQQSDKEWIPYLETVAKALGKQMAMRPISNYYANDGINVCPSCETDTSRRILFGWEKHCPDCGQALRWENDRRRSKEKYV